jgi:hypothetical protein
LIRRLGIEFVADFVHRIAPAFALEQQAGDRDDETHGRANVFVSVNDSSWNVNARWRLFAGIDEPAFGWARGAGAVVPKINPKI